MPRVIQRREPDPFAVRMIGTPSQINSLKTSFQESVCICAGIEVQLEHAIVFT